MPSRETVSDKKSKLARVATSNLRTSNGRFVERELSAQKQILSNQSAHRAAHQNDEPHGVAQQPNNKFDERCRPLIVPQLSYAGNLINFA